MFRKSLAALSTNTFLKIQFYHVLWVMRNQVETRNERSQLTSIQQNSMHYLPRGGGEGSQNNVFKNKMLQIQFYQVSWVPGIRSEVETQKERSQLS